MGKCPDIIQRLIERFDQQADQVRAPDYNETQLRIDFVNPMFAELGWDMDNRRGLAEQYREVVHADRVKVGEYKRLEFLAVPRWGRKAQRTDCCTHRIFGKTFIGIPRTSE